MQRRNLHRCKKNLSRYCGIPVTLRNSSYGPENGKCWRHKMQTEHDKECCVRSSHSARSVRQRVAGTFLKILQYELCKNQLHTLKTQSFSTGYTKSGSWLRLWASCIHLPSRKPISIRAILTLSFLFILGLPNKHSERDSPSHFCLHS